MTATLTLPRLGETMEEGRLVAWLVPEGAGFARGDALAEVETDKTVVELPALGPGVMVRHLVAEGARVALDEPVAELAIDGPDWTREEGADPPPPDAIDLPMPRLGETMEEGTLVDWLVAEGAEFARGDPLLEVETDKTVAEFPALAPGRMLAHLAGPGDVVAVGRPIARIAVAGADRAAFLDDAGGADGARTPDPADKVRQPAPPRAAGGPIRATPVARRAARRAGVDLAGLTGTGRRGRIELRDVQAALPGAAADPAPLALEDTGPATAPAVVLIHGFAADRSVWAGLARRLSRAGLRVVTLDLPGHGATGLDAGTAPAMAGPLSETLAALGPGPHHVVAHSMGAIPAVLAAGPAMASLTLIAPAGLGGAMDHDFITGLARPGTVEDTAKRLARMTAGDLPLSSDAIAALHDGLTAGRLAGLAETLAGPDADALSIRHELAALAARLPVHILLGRRDAIIAPDAAMDLSPAIALHLFPDVGHMPQWEAPEPVFRLILRVAGGA